MGRNSECTSLKHWLENLAFYSSTNQQLITASFNPASQEKVAEVVRRILIECDVAIVFVTHDIELVSRYADRILYMSPGHFRVGNVDEILTPDALSKLYGSPLQGHGASAQKEEGQTHVSV